MRLLKIGEYVLTPETSIFGVSTYLEEAGAPGMPIQPIQKIKLGMRTANLEDLKAIRHGSFFPTDPGARPVEWKLTIVPVHASGLDHSKPEVRAAMILMGETDPRKWVKRFIVTRMQSTDIKTENIEFVELSVDGVLQK